jgi:hypothetical protein
MARPRGFEPAYLGTGTKAKENTDVRRVLTPLVKLAEEFGVLLLANNHLNKNGGKALYRILGSIAFVALGRTIHLVVEDADNRENKKLLCDKSNIGSKPLGLTYLIQKCWIKDEEGEEIETSRISWGTKHIDETADEALATDANPNSAKRAKFSACPRPPYLPSEGKGKHEGNHEANGQALTSNDAILGELIARGFSCAHCRGGPATGNDAQVPWQLSSGGVSGTTSWYQEEEG